MNNGEFGGPQFDLRGQPVGNRRVDVSQASVAELVGNLSESTTKLLRQEVALAKAETRQEVAQAGRGVGMLAAGGVAALLSLMMLSFFLVEVLRRSIDERWAYLVVFAIWAVLAAALAASGRTQMKKVNPVPERTQETLREIPDAMRGRY